MYLDYRKLCLVLWVHHHFNLIDETDQYHTQYAILEKDYYFPLTGDLAIHYLELPKFNPHRELGKMEVMELWLTFLKWGGKPKNRQQLEELIERSEPLKMAKEMLEQISADEVLQQKFYAREKARLDTISQIKYAELKGIEKGKLDVAKNMIKAGMSFEQITVLTGLSETAIKQLVQKLED